MLKTALTRRFGLLGVSVAALALSQGLRAEEGRDHDGKNPVQQIKTASPIKPVIVIVGENRSFDHLFATYTPKSDDEKVLNLLSEHIVKADGTPSEKFDRGHQFQITSAPNGGKFFISAGKANKALYTTLPAPDIAGVPATAPFAGVLAIPVRHRRPRPSSHVRSRYPHHQCQHPAAWAIPDDRPDHALRCLYRRYHPSVLRNVSADGLRDRQRARQPR